MLGADNDELICEFAPVPLSSVDTDVERQGYEAALAKLSDYIIIRRRDEPIQALMDPQWEGLVRQNLRMLLEQAQIALLSGNQLLYRDSLERAQHRHLSEEDLAAAHTFGRKDEFPDLPELAAASPDLHTVVVDRVAPTWDLPGRVTLLSAADVAAAFTPTRSPDRSAGPVMFERRRSSVNALASTAVKLATNRVVATASITVMTRPARVLNS